MTARRNSAAAGAVGIVVITVALFLPGPGPKTSDSAAHLGNQALRAGQVVKWKA